jgi:hypothetical protein
MMMMCHPWRQLGGPLTRLGDRRDLPRLNNSHHRHFTGPQVEWLEGPLHPGKEQQLVLVVTVHKCQTKCIWEV